MNWQQRTPAMKVFKDDTPLEKIAKVRGIKDVDRFLNPTDNELHSPYLLKNIETAAKRIVDAINNSENIVISYDPDVDGITASTILLRYLKNYTENVDYIYGERSKDGHGIAQQIKIRENIEKLRQSDLLIIVDSSSNDVEACRKISEYGIDIVIIDHHVIEEKNPYALIVNPQQDDYPNKFLSGAGVVFKLLQVLEDMLGNNVDIWQYIDLVAIGMVADVMRVDIMENRCLIIRGLKEMQKGNMNIGIKAIINKAKVNFKKINSTTIGFSIAPMINGVARLDNVGLPIRLLLTDDEKEAKDIVKKMSVLNDERRSLQKEYFDRYLTKVDTSKKILVLFDEESNKGFNGIVAQQLASTFKRPVLVGRIHENTASGSFRSYGQFNMKSFLQEIGVNAIGHESAGGFSFSADKLDEINNLIEEKFEFEIKEPTIIYDIGVHVNEVKSYIDAVEKFNLLHGNGFPKIVIKVSDININESTIIGKNKDTVKIKTFDDIELIKFRINENDEHYTLLGFFDNVDVVGELRMNEWYNFGLKKMIAVPQLIIEDIKIN